MRAAVYTKPNFADGPVAPDALYGDFAGSCLNQPMIHAHLRERNEARAVLYRG